MLDSRCACATAGLDLSVMVGESGSDRVDGAEEQWEEHHLHRSGQFE